MPTVDLSSYKVVSNELSSSTKFDNLVDAIQAALNGLDNANIAAAAAVAVSKLAAGSNGQFLGVTSGVPTWQALPSSLVSIYDRAATTVDVANTTTETSIYTKSITGGDMGTNRKLRLTMTGDFLHNNVAGDTVTWRVKFGGTTFWALAASFSGVTGAGRHPWYWVVEIYNLGAANSQQISGFISTEPANNGAPVSGIGLVGSGTAEFLGSFASSGLGTIDTSSNQTLDITAQWSAASANDSWRMRGALLELI